MPVECYEDSLDLSTRTVATVPFSPSARPGLYPYPDLVLGSDRQMITYRVVILENQYLRAVICPDLGGRILEIHDKRTSVDVLGRVTELEPVAGGPRGVQLLRGLEFYVGPAGRGNAMGLMDAQIRGSEDEASVILFEMLPDIGCSLHMTWSMPGNAAEIRIDFRLTSREATMRPIELGLELPGPGWTEMIVGDDLFGAWNSGSESGFGLVTEPGGWDQIVCRDGSVRAHWIDSTRAISPYGIHSGFARLQPATGIGEMASIADGFSLGLAGDQIRIQSCQDRSEEKLYLLKRDGETVEAPLEGKSAQVWSAGLAGELANPEGIKIRRGDQDLLVWPLTAIRAGESRIRLYGDSPMFDDLASLNQYRKDPSFGTGVAVRSAMMAARTKDIESAILHLQVGLGRDPENALLWWLVSTLHRVAGLDSSEELAQAHYLGPTEPALRAESFLSQSPSQGKEPNPLITPIASNWDALLDITHFLLDAGLYEDAARWMDEALRHGEIPLMRYMQAWLLMTQSRMQVEAADAVRRAESAPIQPPYPHRALEIRAVRELHATFPDSKRLRDLSDFLNLDKKV